MALDRIEDLIEDMRLGRMVILLDDEDRENEGDLILAAEHVTPAAINFMATHARGLICLTLTAARCDQLNLAPMVEHNGAGFATAFTVSIEAREGVTTGISAADRSTTIHTAIAPDAHPRDLVQPGHIFPLRAREGGVLSRAGHTEAGCDLAHLAGKEPAAVIVEIMNEDGTMARRPELEAFAQRHGIRIGTIADLIQYRLNTEKTVVPTGQEPLQTIHGNFTLHTYEDTIDGDTHLALTMGEMSAEAPTLVRVHVMDPLRDLVGAEHQGPTTWSLWSALEAVAAAGHGVVVVLASNESSQSLLSRATRLNCAQEPPKRRYSNTGTGSQILADLGVSKLRLMGAPLNYKGLAGFDLEVIEVVAPPGE
ncbi:bifunctional 3,4-dihydroxy-2-butanone-4-phosphate synthase/GTP cyclohydrolase II [Halomonas dongshanensis]|uniref:3,4-dihydroxy-2-butanone 4-phosphate synthase n=1 Tax=Halomonas dongshanensis TaxID=2890835 RepID=A0ABT2EHN7_9GAMM|nr:bifunctional 3,4-dihydroxy-2-butanone-4-phosphate synthase/GTP cyclohydrolase II [Halomonas dongshanensis]MCS2611116.1 3,4-dihydroxy-2-butanone-4-phosphate synthase [Halomonas dongshanensis]